MRTRNPRPGAFTQAGGKRLIVWRARAVDGRAEPGSVVSAGTELVVATGEGALSLEELQLEGKRALPAGDFVRGRRIEVGRSLAGN